MQKFVPVSAFLKIYFRECQKDKKNSFIKIAILYKLLTKMM